MLITGNGIFKRFRAITDPREISDIEYYGDIMYNMEADSETGYLIFNNIRFSSPPMSDYDGNFRIRGNFKRVAFIASQIKDTKITIISDDNPEIFIVGSDIGDSMISIIDNNGNPHEGDKIRYSTTMPDESRLASLLDYIRSDSPDILEEQDDSGVSGLLGAGIVACLAAAGMAVAQSSRVRSENKKENLHHVESRR